jgi:hypothetical protein
VRTYGCQANHLHAWSLAKLAWATSNRMSFQALQMNATGCRSARPHIRRMEIDEPASRPSMTRMMVHFARPLTATATSLRAVYIELSFFVSFLKALNF